MEFLIQHISDYGLLLLFLTIMIEDFGLPVPGETALIGAALLAARGDFPIALVALAGWLGAVVGDNIGYAIGRYGGRRLLVNKGSLVGITPQRVAKIENFFHRYGGAVVLLARFIEGLRQLNGLVAGAMLMPWQRFLIYNAIGAALWIGVWGIGVYFLGHKLGPLLPHISSHKLWLGIGALVIVLALAVLAVHRYRRNGH
ncbi:MAG TPA: DedA family protein [Nitrococcus sp.]|nr:DedA family protein [Nitrococcus sp.]